LLYGFNGRNPTGSYKLELSRMQDRVLLTRLLDITSEEEMAIEALRPPGKKKRPKKDTPGQGGEEPPARRAPSASFRNVRLDGVACDAMAANGWAIPARGRLEFDLVPLEASRTLDSGSSGGGGGGGGGGELLDARRFDRPFEAASAVAVERGEGVILVPRI